MRSPKTPCTDSLVKESCTAASAENLSRRSCARSLLYIGNLLNTESELVAVFFTVRVALVRLVGSILQPLMVSGPFHRFFPESV